jgi:hypothetical protein
MLKLLVPMGEVLHLIDWRRRNRLSGWDRGRCPVHDSQSRTSLAFAVKGDHFRCFKCGAHGDQLELYGLVRAKPLYEACVELCQALNRKVPYLPRQRTRRAPRNRRNDR